MFDKKQLCKTRNSAYFIKVGLVLYVAAQRRNSVEQSLEQSAPLQITIPHPTHQGGDTLNTIT